MVRLKILRISRRFHPGSFACQPDRAGNIPWLDRRLGGGAGPWWPISWRGYVAPSGSGVLGRQVSRLVSAGYQVSTSCGFDAIDEVDASRTRLAAATDVHSALSAEARAAIAYWGAMSPLPINFAKRDLARVPEHWRTLGERHSTLSGSPRLATTPANAILNYLYGLGEFASSLALVALGLDPGIGWAHRDSHYRESAALDLLEAIRPGIDSYVCELLSDHTFTRRDFLETPAGQVRLASGLAKSLATSTLARWERDVAPVAEEVARTLADSASPGVRVRTRLTQADRMRGRKTAGTSRAKRLPPACRICGVGLEDSERKVCDACLPEFESERARALAAAGKRTLEMMRSAAEDPAQSVKAKARRAEASRATTLSIRAWEREHGKVKDQERYEREILPAIQELTVPTLMAITGLSQHYCWRVRTGRKSLHPMHWDAVMRLHDASRRSIQVVLRPTNAPQ